jgi:hypothetical protein
MIAIAIVFTLLFLVVAAGLALGSIHGPNYLETMALLYVVVANVVWWWSFAQFRRRGFKTGYFALVGVGLLAMGVAFGGAAHLYSEFKDRYRVDNTKISDVRDELLRNEDGQPIGIRFEFTAEFPFTDYYSIEPNLQPDTGYSSKIAPRIPARSYNPSPLRMRVVSKSVEPFPSREDRALFDEYQGDLPGFGLRFDSGVAYRFRFDLTPSYMRKGKSGAYCIAYPDERNYGSPREVFDALVQMDVPAKYEIRVNDTPYGGWRSREATPETANEYTPKIFYDSIMAGNPPPCDPAEFVVY